MHFQPAILHDRRMVTPRWRGQVDALGGGEEAREKGAANAQGARARDGLGDGELSSGAW